MQRPEPPRAILLDYDGVIAQNTIALYIDWVADRLSARGPVSKPLLLGYARTLWSSVRASLGLELLFRALGEPWSEDMLREIEADLRGRVVLDPALPDLVRICERRGVDLRVFSMAKPAVLASHAELADRILPLGAGAFSKSDPGVLQGALDDLRLPGTDVLLVDDSLLVLRAAKIAGMRTALMRGLLSEDQDLAAHAWHIDVHLGSLGDLARSLEEP